MAKAHEVGLGTSMWPDRQSIGDYLTITSGVLGRLVISLVYFLIVANVLSLEDFGIFASVSALGLVLSRALAFGFISPVYRVATVKPRVLGAYWSGLLIFSGLSLPLLLACAAGLHQIIFSQKLSLSVFLLIIAAEVMGWRMLEFVTITLNGLSRFGRAALLVIIGSALRSLAAVMFWLSPFRGLEAWASFYAVVNLICLATALVFFLPSMRFCVKLALYGRRLRDAVSTALSELVFYVQSDLDKVLVLSFAGPRNAGLYAIAMRLIDLTAIPIRSFNQMLVQRIMRERRISGSIRWRALIEIGIGAVSVAGLMAFVVLLWLWPTALGRNVADVAPYLTMLLAVPIFRNLIEYHGELLYASEAFWTRLAMLLLVAALKFSMMAVLIAILGGIEVWSLWLNAVFLLLWVVTAAITYRTLP